ncbi:MAG: hypothetical protein JWL80_664 [Parcubacteria group bacterium]|nr:hypothetical protein [Parcubacteria group bacterium]
MPRNVEDIIPSGDRKSIRSIPIPEGRRKINLAEVLPPEQAAVIPRRRDTDTLPRMTVPEYSSGPVRTSSRKGLWIGAVIALVALGLVVFSLFKGATLTYVPKSGTLAFDHDTYMAYKNGENKLLFSVIKLSEDSGLQAPASGGETVSIKSSGTAIVYNNEKTPQRLVKNTRFETDGKIYRVLTDITVPAQKTSNGTVAPGSLEVTLVADKPGAEFNIPLSDFTIPGLKGDPRFTTMYARSKTAMTGGLVGTQKKVNDADLTKARTTLEATLKDTLYTKAKAQVPEDFILFPSLSTIAYELLPQSNPTDAGVTINERANYYGVMFKKTELANFLASKKGTAGLQTNMNIPDLLSLDFQPVSQNNSDLLKAEDTTFQVTGTVQAVAITDEAALAAALAGTDKSTLPTVLTNFPSIESASAVIRPFWSKTFPSDASKIKIIAKPLK